MKNGATKKKQPSRLPASIPLPDVLDIGRPMAPFVAAVLRQRPELNADWLALTDLASTLDHFLGMHIDGVRAFGTRLITPTILFTIGTVAFAVSPIGIWEECHEPDTPRGTAPLRLVEARCASVDTEWFPLDEADIIPLADLITWVANRMPLPMAHGQALHAYTGPRISGEHFFIDIFLPTALEGCSLL
jgi:hypothetical protein